MYNKIPKLTRSQFPCDGFINYLRSFLFKNYSFFLLNDCLSTKYLILPEKSIKIMTISVEVKLRKSPLHIVKLLKIEDSKTHQWLSVTH